MAGEHFASGLDYRVGIIHRHHYLTKTDDDQIEGIETLHKGNVSLSINSGEVSFHFMIDLDVTVADDLQIPILNRSQIGFVAQGEDHGAHFEDFLRLRPIVENHRLFDTLSTFQATMLIKHFYIYGGAFWALMEPSWAGKPSRR